MTACTKSDSSNFEITIDKFRDGIHHWELFHPTNYDRYGVNDIREIADNLISYQNEDGGWPKNIDILAKIDLDSVVAAQPLKDHRSTLDNRNTFPQIEYLAKVYSKTGIQKYHDASLEGIDYILTSQKQNGGWRGWDVDAIAFNDEVMTGAMDLLLDIKQSKPWYDWINNDKRNEIVRAFDRGLVLVLNCQVIQNGHKTAWAQQHDNNTLDPVKGRSYELPAITAFESTPIIRMLMRIENPDRRVKEAIEGAISWLENSKIKSVKIDSIKVNPDTILNYTKDYQVIVDLDSSASARWARYYDLVTNTPIFCRRDGVQVSTFNEIDIERRWGYEWYGTWPESLLEKEFPIWKKRIRAEKD